MEIKLDGLVELADENIHFREGDYIKGGLLHCGKCHTPKQGKFQLPWGEIRPYMLCKCEVERAKREEQEQKARELRERIRINREEGFPDAEMRKWIFAKDDEGNKRISTMARNYVDNFAKARKEGKGLLLFGNVGTGKSFIAACIVNALIDMGYPCMMTDFTRLLNTLQGMYEGRQTYIDSLSKYSLLAIDDLGVEGSSDSVYRVVYGVIDSRYRAGLPLIVTTNLTSEQLKKPQNTHEERIFSRLMEMCIPIEVKGCDRRKEKLKEDFSEYKDILGI